MSEISLSQKQSDTWHLLEDKQHSEVLYGGAGGGGKSYLGCIWHITRRTTYPGTRGLIGRSTLKALKDSTMVTFFKVAGQMGYRAGEHYKYNAQDNVVKWSNGSVTLFKDLAYYPSDPDFTSMGSTEFTDAFIDEVTDITEKAFEIVTSRIRWMLDDYKLSPTVLATCNPSPGWVKKRFVSDDEGHRVTLKEHQSFISALPDDNPDEAFKEIYISQLEKLTDDYDRRRLRYGDWDVKQKVLRPFAICFDRARHVSLLAEFDSRKLIYISFDFNLDPFGFIFQHKWADDKGYHCHTFDEGKIRDASLEAGLDWIKTKYGRYTHNFVITGDKMGDRRDMGQIDRASYYSRMARYFKLRPIQIETHGNPQHKISRDDVNYTLTHFDDFIIHPNCRESISDMQSVEVDAYGKIVKENRQNVNQRSDFLDCFTGDTMIETISGSKRIDQIEIGESVITSKGVNLVFDTWSSIADVYEWTSSDGRIIKCTKGHKFMTNERGWCEIYIIFEQRLTICSHQLQLTTTELIIENTQNNRTTILEERGKDTQEHYIGKCGSIFMEKYQTDIRSIIRTMTQLITGLRTLSWCNAVSINANTCLNGLKRILSILRGLRQKDKKQQKSGIQARMVGSGILRTVKRTDWAQGSTVLETAHNAVINTKGNHIKTSSAPINVNLSGEENQVLTMRSGNVKYAKPVLTSADTLRVKDAQTAKQLESITIQRFKYLGPMTVYDISVETNHEFYANGLLAHNCLRYSINDRFIQKWLKQHQLKK